MPELPEMENYRVLLNEKISGKSIQAVEIEREKSVNLPSNDFSQQLLNRKVIEVKRRAKYLIFTLDSGKSLLLHLMLGGWIYFGGETDTPNRTKQVELTFSNGTLSFIGLRLGYLHLHSPQTLQEELSKLGPEPLEPNFSLASFLQIIKNRRGTLKTTLINQSFIAGIGNCYSDEICYHAGILPFRKINELKENEKIQLFHSMQSVLRSGTNQGGYMEHPLYEGDRLTGNYQSLVYDREGDGCHRCNSVIKLEMISSRKTFYCPNCQH